MTDSTEPTHAGMGDEQRRVRIEKLARLRDLGVNPYPGRFERTHGLADARGLPPGTGPVRIAGRVLAIRIMGKLTFVTLRDGTGRCQAAIRRDAVGEEAYDVLRRLVDIGDFLGVEGTTFTTRTGEPTVDAAGFLLLGKTLRPLPEKWHGLTDREACWRRRYLDLAMNEATMERFVFRSRLVRALRAFLEDRGFVEVDTPVLQPKASGALARPFIARHNALDMDVFLRIAPETWLKRCIVGGFDRVFEFARCFRNEGMDPSHLQDFTMLEFYAAWWDFEDNMRFTEEFLFRTLTGLLGTPSAAIGGRTVDFTPPWPRHTLRDLILRDSGIDVVAHPDAPSLRSAVTAKGLVIEDMDTLSRGSLIDQLWKKVSRPRLVGPAFVTAHPIDLSPLARRNDTDPAVADRFQLVVNGWEIVNAYSELVDPLDQRERFLEQVRAREAGDEEAMVLDEDYLTAMEHGMPPISGFGMGIDRLAALLCNQENLRDVVLFPLLRPED